MIRFVIINVAIMASFVSISARNIAEQLDERTNVRITQLGALGSLTLCGKN